MTPIKINIVNSDKEPVSTDFDLVCLEKLTHMDKVVNYSVVTIELPDYKLTIRFDWKEDKDIKESDFVYVSESSTIFFTSQNQWGAIDLETKTIKRHEQSTWKPTIEIKEDFILIEDDLTAESTRLNGDRIHSVPIDPPTELEEFEDRIEYNSPVFGRQVLKTK
jgi:hypothetical protein